jgi:hypothetical protein
MLVGVVMMDIESKEKGNICGDQGNSRNLGANLGTEKFIY